MPYGIHTRGSPYGLHTVDSDSHSYPGRFPHGLHTVDSDSDSLGGKNTEIVTSCVSPISDCF